MKRAGFEDIKPQDTNYSQLRKRFQTGIRKAVVDHMGHLRRNIKKKSNAEAAAEEAVPVDEDSLE
jgi:hypothetical protein